MRKRFVVVAFLSYWKQTFLMLHQLTLTLDKDNSWVYLPFLEVKHKTWTRFDIIAFRVSVKIYFKIKFLFYYMNTSVKDLRQWVFLNRKFDSTKDNSGKIVIVIQLFVSVE